MITLCFVSNLCKFICSWAYDIWWWWWWRFWHYFGSKSNFSWIYFCRFYTFVCLLNKPHSLNWKFLTTKHNDISDILCLQSNQQKNKQLYWFIDMSNQNIWMMPLWFSILRISCRQLWFFTAVSLTNNISSFVSSISRFKIVVSVVAEAKAIRFFHNGPSN